MRVINELEAIPEKVGMILKQNDHIRDVAKKYAHSQAMMATIPFVLYGVFRYLQLVHRRDLGEEPENVLLSDRPILACVALWGVTAAAILALT